MKTLNPNQINRVEDVVKLVDLGKMTVCKLQPTSTSETNRIKDLINIHPFFDCVSKSGTLIVESVPLSDRDRRAQLIFQAATLLMDAGYFRSNI